MNKRIHVLFSGNVQGVGFRFTALSVASDLGVSGWVKNLDDGRVEILAEGESRILDSFLERLKKDFSSYIGNTDIQAGQATGEFKGFEIKF